MSKPVILTGIRSNDDPTIANYLGAITPMVELQKMYGATHKINMFVPDLHSFTMPIDHSKLYANTIKNLSYFVAAGLDVFQSNTYVYRQSFIPAHSELAWILDCFTYVGEMQRMNEYKDKSTRNVEGITMGLLNYPVLMAADILLYGASYVPVGKDQFQHLEITRDIAMRFNGKFGDIFTVPYSTADQMKFMSRDSGLRIRSLTEPTKKMSKSSADPKSKINMHDSPALARKKIMSAVTDTVGEVNFNYETQPGVTSLLHMLALLQHKSVDVITNEWQGSTRYGELKAAVADEVERFLYEFQARYENVDTIKLMKRIEDNEAKMNEIAGTTLLRVQKAVGLR